MKQKMFFLCCFIFGIAAVSLAQPGSGGGFQRQTVEQRVEAIHKKLDSAFNLGPEKLVPLDTALTVLFQAQDAKMQELMSGGMPDREVMMAERKKYTDARDEMIKSILTDEQYVIWKEKIQPSMQQGGGRGPGGGGGNRQN